jgi:hypothetical protein
VSLDNVLGMSDLRPLVRAAAGGSIQNVRLLPQQTLGNTPVYVVAITSGPDAHMATLYIDAQDYTVRGLDVTMTLQGTVQPLVSVRVTGRDTVPLAAVPAGTFALGAPVSARVQPPEDGVQFLSVAQAVALPDLPALLLAGDTDGLRLHSVVLTRPSDSMASITYVYEAPGGLGALDGKSLYISIYHWPSPTGALTVYPGTLVGAQHPLTFTVARQRVQATYTEDVTIGSQLRYLTYQQGATEVVLHGVGLSKDEFFAAVEALVAGTANPAVATQLRRELDAATAVTMGTP